MGFARPRALHRDGRIRTGDPLNPIQVRYRTAPRPGRNQPNGRAILSQPPCRRLPSGGACVPARPGPLPGVAQGAPPRLCHTCRCPGCLHRSMQRVRTGLQRTTERDDMITAGPLDEPGRGARRTRHPPTTEKGGASGSATDARRNMSAPGPSPDVPAWAARFGPECLPMRIGRR